MIEARILAKLNEINDEVYAPNSGGCAIIAYAVVEAVKRLDPSADATVVYLFEEKPNCKDERIANLRKGIAESCTHAITRINGAMYDTNGIRYEDELKCTYRNYQELELDQNITIKSINDAEWNDTFDRVDSVETILEIMDIPEHKMYIDIY